MGRPSFSPPPKKQRLYVYSWQGKVDAFTCQGGKITDRQVFLHPDNIASAQEVDTYTSQGGERMGWPSFSPPPKKKQRLFAYSWQGKVDAFTCQGGKITDQPSFSPPR